VLPLHLLDALLAELLRILSDSGLLRTHHRVLLLCTPCTCAQCPLGRALQNSQQNYVFNCVSATQPYLLRCSATSKVFPLPELLILSSCASARPCLTPQSSEVHSCTGIQSLQHSVMPSRHETSKILNLRSNTLPAIA
jgi:hypothetical protein